MNETAFDLVRQSVMEHSMTDDERLLEQLRITRDKELPEMDFLFRIFDKPCLPRGELVAVTGKAKSGKTLFASMLMVCCVKGEVLQVQRPLTDSDGTLQRQPLRCLWYDTEQSEQSTQDILKNRILRMAASPRAQPHPLPSSPVDEGDIYKTTWLDALMPPELVQYRCRQSGARAADKDEQLRATEFGLINMDEIDRMSEQELNALKSLITASDVNVRAAYAVAKERRLRMASYVASGNKERFLTDTTGNRRWLPFSVTAIDSPFDHPMPYAQMYAQAWALVQQGFDFWFSLDDIRSVASHVEGFMVETNEQQLLPVYFAPCEPGTTGAQLLTVAEISAKLTLFGNIRKPLDVRQLGALLKKMGYVRGRLGHGKSRGYIVLEKSAESINAQRKLMALQPSEPIEPIEPMPF